MIEKMTAVVSFGMDPTECINKTFHAFVPSLAYDNLSEAEWPL
jgi:hypothetical protein